MYILPGFQIAKEATDRHDLQLRMQGNAFLGAFFKVSPLLSQFGISEELFRELVLAQYNKKFGRFGDAVVQSNMQVMIHGGERLQRVEYGEVAAIDASSMRGLALEAVGGCGTRCGCETPAAQPERIPMYKLKTFDDEYRAGLGYESARVPFVIRWHHGGRYRRHGLEVRRAPRDAPVESPKTAPPSAWSASRPARIPPCPTPRRTSPQSSAPRLPTTSATRKAAEFARRPARAGRFGSRQDA